jgi:intracellular septation protein
MKLLYDFFPILLFFVAYKVFEDPAQPQRAILVATAVAIVATAVQVGVYWWREHRVERMHLVTLALILVLGGATLLLNDEIYIKWKPTVVNWLFALVFLTSQFVGRAPVTRRLMEGNIQLPDGVWTRLNLSWVGFFFVLGLANLYVVYSFDTATWVNFKLFGLIGLTLLFALGQGLYLARYIKEEPGDPGH